MVGDRLCKAIAEVECMRSERSRDFSDTSESAPQSLRTIEEIRTEPLVVRLVQSFVNQRVMQSPVNPVDAIVREDEEAGPNGSVSYLIFSWGVCLFERLTRRRRISCSYSRTSPGHHRASSSP